jgi:hypothetical protein
MRRVGRRLSGGSRKEGWRYSGLKVILSVKEFSEGVSGGRVNGVCKSSLNVVRSGPVASGKASGQPSQSLAVSMSIDKERMGWWCFAALSCAQIDTQATNSHKKVIGSNAAINLLSGKRDINTAKIIHIQFALSY